MASSPPPWTWARWTRSDFRRRNPRFAGQAGQANQAIVDAVRSVADAKGVTPAQVALAWVYAQADRLGVPLAPIPGTKRVKWLEQNVAALDITLTAEELAVLDPLPPRSPAPATKPVPRTARRPSAARWPNRPR